MSNEKIRTVFLYKNYFTEFFDKQKQKVKDKIIWTFKLIETILHVPEEYLKHVEGKDGLYEIRIHIWSDIFRIFCFFDKGKLIVVANGFQKKSHRSPKRLNERLK